MSRTASPNGGLHHELPLQPERRRWIPELRPQTRDQGAHCCKREERWSTQISLPGVLIPEHNIGDGRDVLSPILHLHQVLLWSNSKLQVAVFTVGSKVPLHKENHCHYDLWRSSCKLTGIARNMLLGPGSEHIGITISVQA